MTCLHAGAGRLGDGDEAFGSGGWLHADGAVAVGDAQDCLRLPIGLDDTHS